MAEINRQTRVVCAIIALVVLGLMMASCDPWHKCVDNTHETCDGECVCDGFECAK